MGRMVIGKYNRTRSVEGTREIRDDFSEDTRERDRASLCHRVSILSQRKIDGFRR